MTAYELLWMYARLRGIPEKKIKSVVEKEIKRLDLLKHVKNYCGTYRYLLMLVTLTIGHCHLLYSGGNKRKLSTAIALVGNPMIVFLVNYSVHS